MGVWPAKSGAAAAGESVTEGARKPLLALEKVRSEDSGMGASSRDPGQAVARGARYCGRRAGRGARAWAGGIRAGKKTPALGRVQFFPDDCGRLLFSIGRAPHCVTADGWSGTSPSAPVSRCAPGLVGGRKK